MVSLGFPTTGLVTNSTTHTIGTKSWVWNGSAWDKATTDADHGHSGGTVVDSFNGQTGDVIGVSSVCGHTGDVVDVVCSFNGLTGHVTGVGSFDGLTGAVLARNILPHIHLAGVSADGGATFGGVVRHLSDTHLLSGLSADAGATFAGLVESSGISCGASTVGSCTLSSGVVTATLFSGTATLALSANNATSATTATNVTVTAVNADTQYRIPFAAGAAAGSAALGLKSDSGNTSEGLFFRPDNATLTTGTVQALGVTLGNRGITFADGTGIVTATRTDSYTGQIETVSDKTYIIDPSAATDRTITGYYIKSGAGTVTATLKNANNTVKAASVATTSGDQSSLANTSVSAGATMSIVTSSNSSATDVVFSVEYTTTS